MKRFLVVLPFALLVVLGCGKDILRVQESSKFGQEEIQARRHTEWIGRMDPFILTEADGTHQLDLEGFLSSVRTSHPEVVHYFEGQGSPTEDTKVIEELRESVPAGNKAIVQEGRNSTLGSACWTYWWGRRCCYWGQDARRMILALEIGGAVPILGAGMQVYAPWARYLFEKYGGFCFNGSWAGGIWLTAP